MNEMAQGRPPPAQTHHPTCLAVVLPLGDRVEGLATAPAALFLLVTPGLRGPFPGLKLWGQMVAVNFSAHGGQLCDT